MADLPRGVRLGIDVGSVRVGVAASDPNGVLAYPVTTLRRDQTGERDMDELAAIVKDKEVVLVVVGLPRSLSGRDGRAAELASAYARTLATRIDPVPVRLTDERFTTVMASRTLSQQGVRGRRQRAVVDQAAAVLILQGFLDSERTAQ